VNGEHGAAEVDAVVVGGGPAGMVAARDLARAGARTVLIDEQADLGGQYFKRRSGEVLAQAGDVRPRGTRLAAEVREAGVDVRTGTLVWGVDDDGRTLLTARDDAPGTVAGRVVVLATGAHERVLPVPGWELPGVVTPGLALHLATIDRVPVGRRVMVAGSGPFLLQVAVALLDVGVEVAGVLEAGHPYRPDAGSLRGALHPRRLAQFAGYRARLAAARVPVRQGHQVVEVHGDDHVEAVTVAGRGGRRRVPVDAVALGWGFRPNSELAGLLGCAVDLDPVSGDRRVRADERGGTARDDVLVAGEVAGVAGVEVALRRGTLAALVAARRLGHDVPAGREDAALHAVRTATGEAAWTLARFGPAPAPDVLDDDALACRCEAVRVGEVRASAAAGPDALKQATRLGMGPCQGRQCLPALAALGLATRPDSFPARMPVRPVRIGVLAAAASGEPPPSAPADSARAATPARPPQAAPVAVPGGGRR
jgi:D-hydroxyproline dehydrogenase subunit alpha